MSFVDRERYEILMEKVQDLYRNLGLTVEHAGIQIDESGEEVLMVVARVRETAYERIVTDQDEKARYNQMLSRQNEANLERRREAIKRAFEQEATTSSKPWSEATLLPTAQPITPTSTKGYALTAERKSNDHSPGNRRNIER